MLHAVKENRPDHSLKEIQKVNDILAFADDTLITSELFMNMRTTIDSITREVIKFGVEINPLKCSLMTHHPNEESHAQV